MLPFSPNKKQMTSRNVGGFCTKAVDFVHCVSDETNFKKYEKWQRWRQVSSPVNYDALKTRYLTQKKNYFNVIIPIKMWTTKRERSRRWLILQPTRLFSTGCRSEPVLVFNTKKKNFSLWGSGSFFFFYSLHHFKREKNNDTFLKRSKK